MEGQGQEQQGPQSSRPSNKRLQQTQAQVDEVVGIMKVNVEKVLERDTKLSQLDDRADALQVHIGSQLQSHHPRLVLPHLN
jgi:vesicle-associated membrane protein 2